MRICNNCKIEFGDDFVFCNKCGTKLSDLTPECKKCGYKYPDGTVFCPKCGNKVGKTSETEPQNRNNTESQSISKDMPIYDSNIESIFEVKSINMVDGNIKFSNFLSKAVTGKLILYSDRIEFVAQNSIKSDVIGSSLGGLLGSTNARSASKVKNNVTNFAMPKIQDVVIEQYPVNKRIKMLVIKYENRCINFCGVKNDVIEKIYNEIIKTRQK